MKRRDFIRASALGAMAVAGANAWAAVRVDDDLACILNLKLTIGLPPWSSG